VRTELFAVTPTRKREGRALWPRIEEETILSLGLGASFFLLIDGQLVWKEEKKPTTHTENEREY